MEDTISKCRLNDRQAQKELYEHYYGLVMSVTQRYSNSKEEAKELANDIFYKIFTKLDKYESGTNFKGWIIKVAQRTCIDKCRSLVKQPTFVGDELIPELEVRCDLDILNKLEVEEKVSLLQKLSPAYKLVFNLYVVEGYTHEEIAKELSISEGASKSNLFKARLQLSKLIEKYELT